ncbi:glycerol-3-phosphate acyltransferase 1, mitochondrial-like isoform X1 [Argiope bruennichi]|uniref:glycerol-3-phosphate acyltransferase 1, mitochondrial-like isoform X1 n=2 Tax=Argiope bruennichi TaxID=94029 RepID=UPI002494F8DD|nr:glycerol-3-phosphate acyltransferase 1, mitochondrial-like isoform X1 [Argiope bruennichi]
MFAALLALISFYIAIRVSLSEVSRRIAKFRQSWKQVVKTERLEIMSKKELPARRRTGVVNGISAFQKNAEHRKYTKRELCLPFLDSGSLFQSRNENSSSETDVGSSCRISDDNILNMLKVPTENHNASIFDRLFHQISFILRKDAKVSYPDVSEKVLSADRVKTAIKTSVMEDLKGQDIKESGIIAAQVTHKQRAVHVLHQMRSCISSFLLKIAAWVMYKLLGKMLDGIEVRKDQIETLKKVAEENVPMIYLPLHRSHLDYILVTFILFMNDLRAPLVAAGNNLMIPFFGALLRGLGAFFIKRKLDPQNGQRDYVYRAVLHTYMEESLKAGHSLEFFIEGGRSRTGKAVLPKAGLLSIVVDTLMSGGIRDAYIVPIAMSYEKLLDGNFVSEQLGRPKEMESFSSAIQGIWRTLHSNYGTVRVDFCQPFSLKDFLIAAEYSYNSPVRTLQPCLLPQNQCFFNHNMKSRRRSEYGTEVVSEDHRQLIKDCADYVVYTAFSAYSVMSTNALAFLFLTKHRKATSFDHLVNSMDWIREEIVKRNKTISYFGDSAEMIRRSTKLLGKKLVTLDAIKMDWYSNNNRKTVYYKPSVNLPDVLELQYYANSVVPVFLLESIIVNAIYSLLPEESRKNADDRKDYVLRKDILKYSLELSSILQYEFIFSPPGTGICTVLNATIDDLLDNSLLHIKKSDVDKNDSLILNDSKMDDFFAYGNHAELQQEIKLNLDDGNNTVQFLQCVLSPFIESYFLVAGVLYKLIDSEMEETQLLQDIKNLGLKKIHLGQIFHEESLGLDTLKNGLKLFESWKILNVRTHNSQKMYSLQSYYNDFAKIEDVVNRIGKYKK